MATAVANLQNFMEALREAEKATKSARVTFTTTPQCENGEPERSYIQNLKLRIDRSIILHLEQALQAYGNQPSLQDNIEDPHKMMFTEEKIGHHYATKTKTLRVFWNMWVLREFQPHFGKIVNDGSWMFFEHEDKQFPVTVQYETQTQTQQAILRGVPTRHPELLQQFLGSIMQHLANKGNISKEAEIMTCAPRSHTRNAGEMPEYLHATEWLITYKDNRPGQNGTIPVGPTGPALEWQVLRPRRPHVPLDTVPTLANYPVREVQYAAMVENNEIQTDDFVNITSEEFAAQVNQTQEAHTETQDTSATPPVQQMEEDHQEAPNTEEHDNLVDPQHTTANQQDGTNEAMIQREEGPREAGNTEDSEDVVSAETRTVASNTATSGLDNSEEAHNNLQDLIGEESQRRITRASTKKREQQGSPKKKLATGPSPTASPQKKAHAIRK
eukprot:jgi/Picre1/35981/NNA_003438.t1